MSGWGKLFLTFVSKPYLCIAVSIDCYLTQMSHVLQAAHDSFI